MPKTKTTKVSRKKLRSSLLMALNGSNGTVLTKGGIRDLHKHQRFERARLETRILTARGSDLLQYFAEGHEVNPCLVEPRLVPVERPDSLEGYLFRAATLLWSVPVSRGYGRRLRYLVMDDHNDKLIGLFALGDPVFNLACRDDWIGWNVQQREERLSFVLDAYVLGAVPPYSQLLGGKLVGALVASKEIQDRFRLKYGKTAGLISAKKKNPRLVLVTTTSALGRSSLYNRLRLPGYIEFKRIGLTRGWGHFLVPDDLFRQARSLLKEEGNRYHSNYHYKEGPNWRLRALREVAGILGIDGDRLQHGIKREVFAVPLAANWREILLGKQKRPTGEQNVAAVIGRAARERWLLPRSERTIEWKSWTRAHTWLSLTHAQPDLPFPELDSAGGS
jgi:hypothetical protein